MTKTNRAKKVSREQRVLKASRPSKSAKKKQVKRKKTSSKKTAASQRKGRTSDTQQSTSSLTQMASGSQSGDLQGLSRVEQADSESVDELVEEGNVFEAGAVAGVEEADNADEREVHTHEVPEDDVPEEYLDKD